MRIYRCEVGKAQFPVSQAELLGGFAIFCSSHALLAARIIPGFTGLHFCKVFGANLCSFFLFFNFKGKETIIFLPISLSISFSGF